MKKIKLITDATCDLTQVEIEKYDIEIVPMVVTVDGVDYVTIDNEEYLYKMREAKNFSTSQPSVGKFLEVYEKWTSLGYSIISIHVSGALSGTFSTATSVAKEFEDVYVIDSMSASRGMSYFIKEAHERRENGETIEQIVSALKEKQSKVLTYVTIDKLDNLVRGGRLKKTVGLIGGFLNIKILAKLLPESLEPVEKVRGSKKLFASVIENLKKDLAGKNIKDIQLVHTLALEGVEIVIRDIKETFGFVIPQEHVSITTPVIATHTGEGAVAILVEVE